MKEEKRRMEKALEYLSQDVEEFKNKPWLKNATISHMKRLLKDIEESKIEKFVKDYFIPPLFKGTFNLLSSDITVYSRSRSPDLSVVKNLMLHKISKEQCLPINRLRMHFSGEKDNYYIEEVIEKERS